MSQAITVKFDGFQVGGYININDKEIRFFQSDSTGDIIFKTDDPIEKALCKKAYDAVAKDRYGTIRKAADVHGWASQEHVEAIEAGLEEYEVQFA